MIIPCPLIVIPRSGGGAAAQQLYRGAEPLSDRVPVCPQNW